MPYIWRSGNRHISTDPAELDIDVVHGYLTTSYWATGISRDLVERSIAGSIPFGVFEDGRQVGFARVISDRATFAYVADVFVVPEAQGRGLGRWLVETIVQHPELQGLRRWTLFTADAHGLYGKVGFVPARRPERLMELSPGPGTPAAPRPGTQPEPERAR
jgi:GNAT superfamily N-acetyltransferase